MAPNPRKVLATIRPKTICIPPNKRKKPGLSTKKARPVQPGGPERVSYRFFFVADLFLAGVAMPRSAKVFSLSRAA